MTTERQVTPKSGWTMLPAVLIGLALAVGWIILAAIQVKGSMGVGKTLWGLGVGAGVVAFISTFVVSTGFFTLQPNSAAVLLMFGEYRGTVRETGFFWANPFMKKERISLRTRNFNTEKLKVNDLRGSPIEIAAVVVWHVVDTTKAVFDVENYTTFVNIQSETAIRHLASEYPYDSTNDQDRSLRGSMDEVSKALAAELQERLEKAGIAIEDARLSHLAYAPEIAGAMLRRQQAEAVVAARMKIVEGAVGMVEAALDHMQKSKSIVLDDERKAAMVSNLMVVLCGDHSAQPVVNTGSLYS
jgi:regulator of protease activity HflC (stomatin/prohibitin superfamily)